MKSMSNKGKDHHVPHSSLLVVLDATNEDIAAAPLYWTLGNVARKGDSLKILGIITTPAKNSLGLGTQGDHEIHCHRSLQLQNVINIRMQALDNIPHVKELCEKAGVKLEMEVKAGLQAKVIAVDEAKAIGAYHVVLDRNMKKDKKYFVNNLTCFVSRSKSGGGVDTIRTFTMLAGSQPNSTVNTSSSTSYNEHTLNSSTSSTSFDLLTTCDSSEDFHQFSTWDSQTLISWPTTGDSMTKPSESLCTPADYNKFGMVTSTPSMRKASEAGLRVIGSPVLKPVKTDVEALREETGTPAGTIAIASQEFNSNTVLKSIPQDQHNAASTTAALCDQSSGLKTMSLERDFRAGQGIQDSVAGSPLLLHGAGGAFSLNARSIQKLKNPTDNIKMDMYWPIFEWADCRRSSGLKITPQANHLGGANLHVRVMSNMLASVRRRQAAKISKGSYYLYILWNT